jgi:hypothetical protein
MALNKKPNLPRLINTTHVEIDSGKFGNKSEERKKVFEHEKFGVKPSGSQLLTLLRQFASNDEKSFARMATSAGFLTEHSGANCNN